MTNVNELCETKQKNQTVRKELFEAKKLYKSKEYDKALEIYESHFNEHPELLNNWDRIFYSWSIYQIYIKNQEDETQLFEYTELITELISQADLNNAPVCAYTLSVFRVLNVLKENSDWEYMIYWLDKLNPDLLDEKQGQGHDIVFASNREKYYNFASKAYLECGDYEGCIEVSKRALNSLSNFTNNSDVWYNWRIAKSLKELNQNEEALKYLEEVSKVKRDWFVAKEIAENYYILNDTENAKKYITDAVLTNDPDMIKVNLYYLIYKILKDEDEELALLHAEYFTAIKLEGDARIPEEIEDLMIDEDELDIKDLKHRIKDYWSEYKFTGQELQYGTITKVFEHGKSGFITSVNDESFYFKSFDFKDRRQFMKEGQYVSFYIQKGFDKSKNRQTVNAVNVKRGE
ncbi:tetratricopeptide repeat protein [Methanobrevibacter sp.]|uniref:tetratricopeptide repeat protein n=1 Tax=Methanobrevibacter sp. TaxID=66852 RepID=UPI00388D74FB